MENASLPSAFRAADSISSPSVPPVKRSEKKSSTLEYWPGLEISRYLARTEKVIRKHLRFCLQAR